MPALEPLDARHEAALLAFERENRAFFAATITDRGDSFFAEFAEIHRSQLARQAAGGAAFYLLVGDDGAVTGRFNLYAMTGDAAEVGFRVAESVSGRGTATAALQQLCGLAVTEHGLSHLTAAASAGNAASRRVLVKAGFVLAGPADPAALGGNVGDAFTLDLRD